LIIQGQFKWDFVELLESTSNLIDVHLLCHQAGCPVYVIRNTNGKCAVTWHPCIEEEKNTLNIVINNGNFELLYKDEMQSFDTIEDLKNDMLSIHMLGENPFDSNYLIWSKIHLPL
jgi:hypothetical protein